MKKIYIEEMGCDSRALDAGKFARYFSVNGFKVVRSPARADYILFITCGFHISREDYAMRRLKKLQTYRGELIVGGCIKGTNRKRLDENFGGFSFQTSDNSAIDAKFPDFKVRFADIPDANSFFRKDFLQYVREYLATVRIDLVFLRRLFVSLRRKTFNRPYLLRTSWGCIERHCSYCVIWRAVGRLRSKPLEECRAELSGALARGYRNIVLAGDNVGAWGLDLGLSFPDLIEGLLAVEGKYEVHINDLHPCWITDYSDRLAPLFSTGKIAYVRAPLQSGNDRILSLMNRGHTKEGFRNALARIRAAAPGLELFTHIIVGFPTETEEEFRETLEFVKEMKADMVYVFPYSAHKSATLAPEIAARALDPTAILDRARRAEAFFRENRITC